MAMLTNLHVLDEGNVGDWLSSPLHYLDFPGFQLQKQDIRHLDQEEVRQALQESHLLIGGGGLLFDRFKDEFEAIARMKRAPYKQIAWGIGQQIYSVNRSAAVQNFDYRSYLENFDRVGIRDAGFAYDWVPCASCLHPAFDRSRTAQHEVVVFSHKKFQIEVADAPRMTNETLDFEAVLDFLGSGEVILTSSFHGAYWGTLLGRRVLAFPFSSKFSTLKHQPALYPIEKWRQPETTFSILGRVIYRRRDESRFVCEMADWREYAAKAIAFSDSLEECRNRNHWFHQQIMDQLHS